MSFFSISSTGFSQWRLWGAGSRKSHASSRRGMVTILNSNQICSEHSVLHLPTGKLPEPNQHGEGKYPPSPAPSSLSVSSKQVRVGGRSWEVLVKATAQGCRPPESPRPNHKVMEPSMIPFPPPSLPPHRQGSCVITGLQMNERTATLCPLFKEFLEKPRDNRRDKNKDTRGNFSPWYL